MGTPNWANLKRQGRVKEIGVPWNEEELHAIYELEIPVVYVRDGILTREAYEKALAKDEKGNTPLSRLPRRELAAIAREKNVDFTPAIPDRILVELIESADKNPKESSDELPDYREMQLLTKKHDLKATGSAEELYKRLKEAELL